MDFKDKIKLILIEDDPEIQEEYMFLCSQSSNVLLIEATDDADKGVHLVLTKQPDAVVLDLELPNGNGNGIVFLSTIREMNLRRRPFILVATNNISPTTHQIARNLGADFIITKTQPDYSVEMVLGLLAGVLAGLTAAHGPARQRRGAVLWTESEDSLIDRINAELDNVGISPKHKGRAYLREAIEIISRGKRPNVSRPIADKYGTTSAGVERAMQHAIDRAWKLTDIDILERFYTARVNPGKGVPTTTEFVYYYAEKLKN